MVYIYNRKMKKYKQITHKQLPPPQILTLPMPVYLCECI
jgi:hypothetical protein